MGICNSTLKKKPKKAHLDPYSGPVNIETIPQEAQKNGNIENTTDIAPFPDSFAQVQTTAEVQKQIKEIVFVEQPLEPAEEPAIQEVLQRKKDSLNDLAVPPYVINHKRLLGSPIQAKKSPSSPLTIPLDFNDFSPSLSLRTLENISDERTLEDQNVVKNFYCHGMDDYKFKRSITILPDPIAFLRTSSDIIDNRYRKIPQVGFFTRRVTQFYHNWFDYEFDCIRAIKYIGMMIWKRLKPEDTEFKKHSKYTKYCRQLSFGSNERTSLQNDLFFKIRRKLLLSYKTVEKAMCLTSFDMLSKTKKRRSQINYLPKSLTYAELSRPICSSFELNSLNHFIYSYPTLRHMTLRINDFNANAMSSLELNSSRFAKVEIKLILLLGGGQSWDGFTQNMNQKKYDIWSRVNCLQIFGQNQNESPMKFIFEKMHQFKNLEALTFNDQGFAADYVYKFDYSVMKELEKLRNLDMTFSSKGLVGFCESCCFPDQLSLLKIYCQDVTSLQEMAKIIQAKKFYHSLSLLTRLKKFSLEIMTLLSLDLGSTLDTSSLFTTAIENLPETLVELNLSHSIHLNYDVFPNASLLPMISDKFKELSSLSLNFLGVKITDANIERGRIILPVLQKLKLYNIDSHLNLIDNLSIQNKNLERIELHFGRNTTHSQLANFLKRTGRLKQLQALHIYAYHLQDPMSIILLSLIKLFKECSDLKEFVLDWAEIRCEPREDWLKKLIIAKESLRFCNISFADGFRIMKVGKRVKTFQ